MSGPTLVRPVTVTVLGAIFEGTYYVQGRMVQVAARIESD